VVPTFTDTVCDADVVTPTLAGSGPAEFAQLSRSQNRVDISAPGLDLTASRRVAGLIDTRLVASYSDIASIDGHYCSFIDHPTVRSRRHSRRFGVTAQPVAKAR
jgi:hypothetical protein